MRVLMLSQFYAPIIGGEERLVQDLSQALSRRGHAVAVATQWRPGLALHERDHGVELYRIRSAVQRAGWLYSEPERRHFPPWPDPEAALGLRRVLAAHRPDVVHAHNWLVHSFLPLKAGSGAALVLSLHDYSLVCCNKRLMRAGQLCSGPGLLKCLGCASQHYGLVKGVPTALAHWAMRPWERAAVDLFLPVSQAVAQHSGLTGREWPYQVIPNFVPDRERAQLDADPALLAQLPADGFVMFAGDLSREKGLEVLLQAYAGLPDAPPLVVIGRQALGTQINPARNVVVLNSWPHAAVLEAWHRCSVALVPSVWAEPFGLVVLEAMAAGRPVIASATGGLADIVVPGETGLLVPPGDVDALRAALAQLLGSAELRARLGAAGQRRSQEYRANHVAPQVEAAYAQARERCAARDNAAAPARGEP